MADTNLNKDFSNQATKKPRVPTLSQIERREQEGPVVADTQPEPIAFDVSKLLTDPLKVFDDLKPVPNQSSTPDKRETQRAENTKTPREEAISLPVTPKPDKKAPQDALPLAPSSLKTAEKPKPALQNTKKSQPTNEVYAARQKAVQKAFSDKKKAAKKNFESRRIATEPQNAKPEPTLNAANQEETKELLEEILTVLKEIAENTKNVGGFA